MLIYIVEDDDNILRMEEYALKNSGFEVCGFSDGEAFFTACKENIPDLFILDIMLPGIDGMEILSQLKSSSRFSDIPAIMVTAKASEIDAVSGLDMGADDYITKPFGVMEFISRVKAVLRRSEKKAQEEKPVSVFCVGELVLDDETRSVTVDGADCLLTFKEYELLKYLFMNRGIVLSREKLMENVWGMDYKGETRTIDVHIQSLRRKIKDGGSYIETVRNVGYRMRKE